MSKELIQQQINNIKIKYKFSQDLNENMLMLQEIVKLRNGKIKDDQIYVKSNIKMFFIDALGNEFKMTPSAVKIGHWSSYEVGLTNDPEYRMKELKGIADFRGGTIKEGEIYINSRSLITFIDKVGREFKMTPELIKRGSWSPYESGNVYNSEYHMKEIQKIVDSKGGKIKDGELYVKSSVKMTFIDKLGNEFKMRPNAVKRGAWSPYEAGLTNDPEYRMKELEKIAKSRGGKVKKDEVYVNSNTLINFVDQLGNEFKMTPKRVKRGDWSSAEKNYSENICRQIVEQIYKNKFPSTWSTIRRKNGNNLQLDGYCEELKIAFEYQGEQHFFGWRGDKEKQQESLKNIRKLDDEKKHICKEKGMFLLEVNYYKSMKSIHDIVIQTISDIKNCYLNKKLEIPIFLINLNAEDISVDLTKISHIVKMTDELRVIVKKKEGKIKNGQQYIHSKVKMIFIDKLGNEFKMSPNEVKRGGWSPYESGNVFNDSHYHIKQLENIALSKGGQLKEGQSYINASTELIFIDKLGNEFKRKPGDVKAGFWSPYESTNPTDKEYHFKILQEIAQFKGGKIKEGEKYVNANTEMVFVDKLDNEFKSTPTRLKNGKWSPYESKNPMDKEYHFKILQEIALLNGGEIKEGEKYVDSKIKMTFINKYGNEFKMAPSNIKNGKWPKKPIQKSAKN